MKTQTKQHMLIGIMAVSTVIGVWAQPAPLVEASSAQAAAGTVGAPFYMSPRRVSGNGQAGTVIVFPTGSTNGSAYSTIQAAINSLGAGPTKSFPGGGIIQLTPGIYNESVIISNNFIAGWTIQGAGQFSTVWQGGVIDGRVITCDSIASNDAPLKLTLCNMAIYAMKNTTNSIIYLNHCLPNFHDLTVGTWITATNNKDNSSQYLGLQPGLGGAAVPVVLGNIGVQIAQNQADGGQIYYCNFPGLAIGIYSEADHMILMGCRFDCIGVNLVQSGITLWNTNDIRYIPSAVIVGQGGHGDYVLRDCHWFNCTSAMLSANPNTANQRISGGEIESCTYRFLTFASGGLDSELCFDSGSLGNRVVSTNVAGIGTTNTFTISTLTPPLVREFTAAGGNFVWQQGGTNTLSYDSKGTSNNQVVAVTFIQSSPNLGQIILTGGPGTDDATNGVYNVVYTNILGGVPVVLYTNTTLHLCVVYNTPIFSSDGSTGARYTVCTGTNDAAPLYQSSASGVGPYTSLNGIDGGGAIVNMNSGYYVGFVANRTGNVSASSFTGDGSGLTNIIYSPTVLKTNLTLATSGAYAGHAIQILPFSINLSEAGVVGVSGMQIEVAGQITNRVTSITSIAGTIVGSDTNTLGGIFVPSGSTWFIRDISQGAGNAATIGNQGQQIIVY